MDNAQARTEDAGHEEGRASTMGSKRANAWRGWSAVLLSACVACAHGSGRRDAGPSAGGLSLEAYCRDHGCPRDYDDAVEHAFAGQPMRLVYPACRGARVVATMTSDTSDAWFFEGDSGVLVGRSESGWGEGARYGRVVSLMDCRPRDEPKHFTWFTDDALARACDRPAKDEALAVDPLETIRFTRESVSDPKVRRSVCVVSRGTHFVTSDGQHFRALTLPEWSRLQRALEDAHLNEAPRDDPPPPVVEGAPPLLPPDTTWEIDLVYLGKPTTVARQGATVDYRFRVAVGAFLALIDP